MKSAKAGKEMGLTLANQYQWGNYWLKNVLFTNKQKRKEERKERKKELYLFNIEDQL